MAGIYEQVAGLPVGIETYELERLELAVSNEFRRVTTLVRLLGVGEEGVGEDVTYEGSAHDAFHSASADGSLPLPGRWESLDSFSEFVGALDLFPAPAPAHEVYRSYRRWAVESAALDLALRQAGVSLAAAVEREPQPVTFVVSMGLGEPPSLARVFGWLELYPGLRLKLDARSSWDERLIQELVATGAVDSIDFKGAYRGTVVDQPADASLYRRVAEAFPDAWLEDPDLSDAAADEALRPHRDRITWDAIIHSVDDIEALPFAPRMVNVKPSRFGSLRGLLAAYDWCAARGIRMYGGGQFELGAGRGQIQYLASLFHPDGPNDVAPGGFNGSKPTAGLPASPLAARAARTGFAWG